MDNEKLIASLNRLDLDSLEILHYNLNYYCKALIEVGDMEESKLPIAQMTVQQLLDLASDIEKHRQKIRSAHQKFPLGANVMVSSLISRFHSMQRYCGRQGKISQFANGIDYYTVDFEDGEEIYIEGEYLELVPEELSVLDMTSQ